MKIHKFLICIQNVAIRLASIGFMVPSLHTLDDHDFLFKKKLKWTEHM